jgi:hypothetical protein
MNIDAGLSRLYDDTAEFEVTKFKVILVITSVVCVFVFILGFYLIFKKENYIQIQATVVSQSSCSNTLAPKQLPDCSLVVSYNVNNNPYTNSISLSSSHKAGDIVMIEYDETNPIKIRKPQLKTMYIGLILNGFALVFFLFAYFNYYMSSRSKIYAVASGVSDANNFIRNFRM